MRSWVVVATAVLACSCSAIPQAASLQPGSKVERSGFGFAVFKQKKDAVWTALADAMTSYNWRPQTMDAISGVVFFQSDGRWGATWGSNNNAVARFTTKKVSRRWSSWQHIAIQANIIVKAQDEYHTEVKTSIRFAGCNGFQALFNKYASCRWEPLESNGQLEQELLALIAARMSALSEAELHPPSKPDVKVVASAREQILAFQKIVAAFDLNASADRIMSALVDATASLQTFRETAESERLPRFTTALDRAAKQFAAAVNAKDGDRQSTLGRANTSFADAKRYLANYQKTVQEVESASSPGMPLPAAVYGQPPQVDISRDVAQPAQSMTAPSSVTRPPDQGATPAGTVRGEGTGSFQEPAPSVAEAARQNKARKAASQSKSGTGDQKDVQASPE